MLTRQDIDLLIESLDAWDHRHESGQLLMSMMGGLACRNDGDLERFKYEMERKHKQHELDNKVSRERSILLRAKLIQMRDSLDADSLLNDGKSHG